MIENVNWFAVWNPHYQQASAFGRREIQNIRKSQVAGDEQAILMLSESIYLRIAFTSQSHIADIYSVETRVSKNAGCGTGHIFIG